MELERGTVFGSWCSPISDDRWQERDERPNVKSHVCASFPPHHLSSPLLIPPSSPKLQCIYSQSWKNAGGSANPVHIHSAQMQRHIFNFFFLSSLLSTVSHSPFTFCLVYKVQYPSWGQKTTYMVLAEWTCRELWAFGILNSSMLLCAVCVDEALDDGWVNGLSNFTVWSKDSHHLSNKLSSIIHQTQC